MSKSKKLTEKASLLLELAGSSKGTFTQNPIFLYQVPNGEDENEETVWETQNVFAGFEAAKAWADHDKREGSRVWCVNLRFQPGGNDHAARDVFADIVGRLEKFEELLEMLRYHVGWDGELREVKEHCGHPYLPRLGELMMRHFYNDDCEEE